LPRAIVFLAGRGSEKLLRWRWRVFRREIREDFVGARIAPERIPDRIQFQFSVMDTVRLKTLSDLQAARLLQQDARKP
jgi:hypothetical protein